MHVFVLYYHANFRILILIILDTKINILHGQMQTSYYALDAIAILYRYYGSIVQWI